MALRSAHPEPTESAAITAIAAAIEAETALVRDAVTKDGPNSEATTVAATETTVPANHGKHSNPA